LPEGVVADWGAGVCGVVDGFGPVAAHAGESERSRVMVEVVDMVHVSFDAPVIHTGDAGNERVFVQVNGAWFAPEQYELIEEANRG